DPYHELDRLIRTPEAQADLAGLGWTEAGLRQQWAARGLTPVPPLAWDDRIAAAARGHSQRMADTGVFAPPVPGEGDGRHRLPAAGDPAAGGSENISLLVLQLVTDVAHAHAHIALDIGVPGLGHLATLLSPGFVEVGVGMVNLPGGGDPGRPGVDVYTTEDFG